MLCIFAREALTGPVPSRKELSSLLSLAIKGFVSFVIPGGLLFATTFAALYWVDWFNHMLPTVASYYPIVVPIVGILFGWRFNRSRLVFAVIAMFIADRALVHFGPNSHAPEKITETVFHAVTILLPLNLALFSMIKERGIVTLRGIGRQLCILLQPLAVFLICYYERWDIAAYLNMPLYETSLLAEMTLSQGALLAFGVAFGLTAVHFLKTKGTLEIGFFWALLSVMFGFFMTKNHVTTIFFATAELVLFISAIESSHRMAFRDELTGLPARRALDETLLKLGSTYTVAMLDIDHFKQFNDRYGHQVGDQVLRMVGSKMLKVAGGGKPYRYGGEEFAVVFPGKEVDEALPYLERLRKAIGETPFMLRNRDRRQNGQTRRKRRNRPAGKNTTVTVSIGAAAKNGKDIDAQDVIKAADKALYRAKRAGRNRVRTSS